MGPRVKSPFRIFKAGCLANEDQTMTKLEADYGKDPWHPMSDPVDLKHMGKLLEEAGELVAASSRCVVQGIDEVEPDTGKPNREWLEDEIADVLAGCELATAHFGLDAKRIFDRAEKKKAQLRAWHVAA